MNTTIDPLEKEKFSKMAEEWWDPTGKFKPYINLTLKELNLLGINWLNTFQLSAI